jgi:hypothetical protein
MGAKVQPSRKRRNGFREEVACAIVVSAVFLLLVSVVGWGLLFYFFSGCSTNIAFITLTIILSLLVLAAQLSGEEGSLLASSLVTAYATMLCYTAVARNPNGVCNPQLNSDDNLSIVIGVGITLVSLGYVGWSATADSTLGSSESDDDEEAEDVTEPKSSDEKPKIAGVVTNYQSTTSGNRDEELGDEEPSTEKTPLNTFSNNWKLNVALAAVTCWFSMVLTEFGTIQAGGTVANPQIGKTNMWIIIATQWFALVLYTWTLIAPRVLTDRDFS